MTTFILRQGDVLDCLREIPADTFQCVVTSPPYWGLRDYDLPPSVWGGDPEHAHEWDTEVVDQEMRRGINLAQSSASTRGGGKKIAEVRNVHIERAYCPCGAWRGCLGLEPTPELYIEHMVTVFREVRRVLRPDCTLWLNIGDSYAGSWGAQSRGGTSQLADRSVSKQQIIAAPKRRNTGSMKALDGIKPKDLVGIPWMLAFAMRADGWYLRSEIVWHKPNPMPESVTDRPTKAHETIFLLSKSPRYFYDAEAIAEPSNGFSKMPDGWDTGPGAHGSFDNSADVERESHGNAPNEKGTRNKRSVWTMATQPFAEAHFATFPEELPRTCILAGSRSGDVVLDPFSGAGTTGVAAIALGRDYLGIELNPEYLAMSRRRLEGVCPLLAREA